MRLAVVAYRFGLPRMKRNTQDTTNGHTIRNTTVLAGSPWKGHHQGCFLFRCNKLSIYSYRNTCSIAEIHGLKRFVSMAEN